MISFDLDFFPHQDARGDEYGSFDYWLDAFSSALYSNGNIFDAWNELELEDRVRVRATGPEEPALLQQNWSRYAKDSFRKATDFCHRGAIFQVIFEDVEDLSICACSQPELYILRTSSSDRGLPVDCGCCGSAVPLYRLSHIKGEEDHYRLLGWQKTSSALDRLWMESGVGERFAYRQLARPRSDFFNLTRELAADLEAASKVSTYSFLLHYHKKWGKRCPLCSRKWRWEDSPDELFAFKCDHCRLVSSEASDEKTPLRELHP